MSTIAALNRRLKAANIEDTAIDSIDQTREQLADAQRDQMMHGLRADGTPIGKYRNPAYARMKNAMNPLAGLGNMDWRLTGELHAALIVDAREDGTVVIVSGDEKFRDLAEEHGDPMGLGGEFKEQYVGHLEPVFQTNVQRAVKL